MSSDGTSDESASVDSFGARGTLEVGDRSYEIFRIDAVEGSARLPFSLKVLLENLLRTEDGLVTAEPPSARWRSGTPPPSPTPRSSTSRGAW